MTRKKAVLLAAAQHLKPAGKPTQHPLSTLHRLHAGLFCP